MKFAKIISFCLSTFLAFALPISAYAKDISKDGYKGQILLMETCPGDEIQSDEDEFGSTILTALLTAGVKTGLGALGQRLKESSEEKIIESLHRGDYFYGVSENGQKPAKYKMKYRCIIIATPPKTDKLNKTFHNKNWPKYFGVQRFEDTHDIMISNALIANQGDALQTVVSKLGYGDNQPSSVLVLDIERSKQGKKFRFIPRYFAVPHSPREKSIDSKTRDFAFEIKMTAGGGEKPFALAMLPLKQIVSSQPVTRKTINNTSFTIDPDGTLLASQWMSIPANDTEAAAKLEKINKSKKLLVAAKATVKKHRVNIGGELSVKGTYESISLISSNGIDACKFETNNLEAISSELVSDKKKLAQNLVVKNSGYEKDAIMLDEIESYLKTCSLIESYAEQALKFANLPKTKDKYDAVPFDINVTIKEFRKKPLAAFVASVLLDETVQKSITDDVLGAFDPGTRKKNADTEASELAAAQKALDEAITLANIAIQEYLNATDLGKQTILLLKANQAKRVANRAAQKVSGADIPFPEAGFYIQ